MPDGYGNFDEESIADAVNSASGAAAYMSFGSFVMNDRGLHLEKEMPDPDSDPSEKKTKTVLVWISSPFEVLAQTRDDRSHSWGKMLRWKDPDGRSHEWAMPVEALAGTREEIWRVLMSRGLQIGTEKSHRDNLAQYLSMVRVPDRVRTVARIG